MNKLKRFKIGLFTITLGIALVGASFALADDKAIAEGIILPEELNETTAILTPSVAIAENDPTTQPEEWIDAVATVEYDPDDALDWYNSGQPNLVALANQYQSIDAISNFKSDDITVNQGDGKRDVAVDCALQPNDSMEKLYMTVVVN